MMTSLSAYLFLMMLATIGRPADLTGAWELVAEWTDAPANVQPDGDRHAVEELLASQDNLVIMQREFAVLIVADDGRSRQYSTHGVPMHQCSARGCVSTTTQWEQQTLRQRFTVGQDVALDYIYARPSRNRLDITMVIDRGGARRVVSRRVYVLVE
jgi:hypothetical protein